MTQQTWGLPGLFENLGEINARIDAAEGPHCRPCDLRHGPAEAREQGPWVIVIQPCENCTQTIDVVGPFASIDAAHAALDAASERFGPGGSCERARVARLHAIEEDGA